MGAIGFALFSPRRRSATAETKEIVCNTIAHMQQRTIRQAQCARFAFSTRKRRNKSGFSTRPYLRCLSLSPDIFLLTITVERSSQFKWKSLFVSTSLYISILLNEYLFYIYVYILLYWKYLFLFDLFSRNMILPKFSVYFFLQ